MPEFGRRRRPPMTAARLISGAQDATPGEELGSSVVLYTVGGAVGFAMLAGLMAHRAGMLPFMAHDQLVAPIADPLACREDVMRRMTDKDALFPADIRMTGRQGGFDIAVSGHMPSDEMFSGVATAASIRLDIISLGDRTWARKRGKWFALDGVGDDLRRLRKLAEKPPLAAVCEGGAMVEGRQIVTYRVMVDNFGMALRGGSTRRVGAVAQFDAETGRLHSIRADLGAHGSFEMTPSDRAEAIVQPPPNEIGPPPSWLSLAGL